MTAAERRVALALSGVFATRMLGLFMVAPVFAVFAESLAGSTLMLAGIAVGIYGLTQSVLQIPLGRLSDRIGRKPVILGGLLVFAMGSVIAAMADSITGVIIGRALQGAGAIAGAVMAMAADLTREDHRTKVMAVIGMSIGMAFIVAVIIGPILGGWFGLAGIFWTTVGLAVLGMLIVQFVVPTPVTTRFHRDTEVEYQWLRRVLSHAQLLRLDLGVLMLHFVMTATMFTLPLVLLNQHDFELKHHWGVWIPVLVLSAIPVLPIIIVSEKKRILKQAVVGAVVALLIASLMVWQLSADWSVLVVALWLFFVGFNLLEASLPSLVAKFAPPAHRGTAMGAFSSAQFMGAFLGAMVAGYISQHYGVATVFLANGLLVLLWLVLVLSMRHPPYLSSQMLQVGQVDDARAQQLVMQLTAIRGVAEAVVIREDGIAYLKVDKRALDNDALSAFAPD